MNKPTLKEQAHGEIEKIFRILLPQNGLSVREEQITLCHAMLDTLLKNNIALCDAGVGIGKTYAYLTACILLKKFAPHGPAGSQPVVISTSSVALQDSIIEEYIPFLSRIFLENRVISKPIRAIVRKGKERFVCDARLSQRLEAVKDKNKNERWDHVHCAPEDGGRSFPNRAFQNPPADQRRAVGIPHCGCAENRYHKALL